MMINRVYIQPTEPNESEYIPILYFERYLINKEGFIWDTKFKKYLKKHPRVDLIKDNGTIYSFNVSDLIERNF